MLRSETEAKGLKAFGPGTPGEDPSSLDERRLGALAGALGAVVFVTVFTIEGWLRPEYDWRSMFVSELSLGPRGFLPILSLVFFGVSQLLFARGIASEFPGGKASRAGPILLAAVGMGMLSAGVFVMDPIGTPMANWSWHGWLHGLPFGPAISYGWPVSCFIFWRRFREDPRWRPLATFTLTAGALAALLAVASRLRLQFYLTHPELGHHATAGLGLLQRAHHISLSIWQLVMAVWLYRLARLPETSAGECS